MQHQSAASPHTAVRIFPGFHPIGWDRVWNERPDNNMIPLAGGILDAIHASGPEGSFSGEEPWTMELDSGLLDCTWNWLHDRDCAAFLSAFPSPRPARRYALQHGRTQAFGKTVRPLR